METTSTQAPKVDVASFIAWAEKRENLSAEEKERLARVVKDLQKSCEN